MLLFLVFLLVDTWLCKCTFLTVQLSTDLPFSLVYVNLLSLIVHGVYAVELTVLF